MKQLFTLNHYFFKYKFHFLLGLLFVTGSNYFGVLIPQKIRQALDLVQDKIKNFKVLEGSEKEILYNELTHALIIFSITVVAYMILKGVLMFYMRQTIIVMSRLIEYDMRKEIFRHISTLDQSFFKTYKTGDIMARISEDVSKVRNYLGPGVLYAVNMVTLFVMTIYAMLQVDVTLTIYALLPLPLLSISIYYVSKLINTKSTAIQQQLSVLNSTAQETYSGIRVVKSYVKEDQFAGYFSDQSEEYKKRALSLAMVEAWFQPLMILLIALSTLLVVYVGGLQVFEGKLTAGNIAEFILYVNMLTWPVTSIGWIASVVQEAEASQKRINELYNIKSTIHNINHSDYELKGDIEFKNVTYIYPDTGVKALDNVSFKVKAGQKLAIYGKTAAGKSTIGDLLFRIFDVTDGEILIDGKNIKDHNLELLRQKMGYVPQDTFLFSDTIAANIAFGVEKADEQTIQQYAEYSAVHDDIIRLPKGYESLIGERGVTLSGGQKQRIAIARAFMKNPQLMILDDTLSAVDSNTEQKISQYFMKALDQKTAIVITHRANNLLDYDKIIVLENGRLSEEGTHENLIKENGFYASIYEQQRMSVEVNP
ncbi:MAG: ABC transporter ATP-binding protein [Saprospiraceae bacterium]|nr:ABC transporter ATP-binding protein [Saprospiraceae bacterium]